MTGRHNNENVIRPSSMWYAITAFSIVTYAAAKLHTFATLGEPNFVTRHWPYWLATAVGGGLFGLVSQYYWPGDVDGNVRSSTAQPNEKAAERTHDEHTS